MICTEAVHSWLTTFDLELLDDVDIDPDRPFDRLKKRRTVELASRVIVIMLRLRG